MPPFNFGIIGNSAETVSMVLRRMPSQPYILSGSPKICVEGPFLGQSGVHEFQGGSLSSY